ncbi:MAG TPA: carboxypeptidase-like regulatory domain-containing protein [Bryobacteraceae bacterium]|nr:carboxypeptidase-like regulatory domain-containing protein [Bryobacteraceae bacterium]
MARFFCILALCSFPLLGVQHSGSVHAADQPIPGATVTARQGGAKIVAYTNEDGRYSLELTPGAWDIDIEMFGFTTLHSQITITNDASYRDWTLQVPRVEGAPTEMNAPLTTATGRNGRGGRGGRGGQFGGRAGQFPGRGGQGGGRNAQANAASQPQPAASNAPGRTDGQPAPSSAPNAQLAGRGATQPAFQNVTVTATEAGAQDLASASEFTTNTGGDLADANEAFMITGSSSGGLGAAADEQARRDRLAGRGGGPGVPGGSGGILGAAVGETAFNGILTGGGGDSLGMGGFGSAGANTGFGTDTGGGLGLGPSIGGPGGGGARGGGGGGGAAGGGRGGRGGGGGGGRGGARGARGGPGPFNGQFATFGNRRRDRPTYHGSVFGVVTNSALNAAPFSLNGQDIAKPSSASEQFGFNIGGPLRIPKLVDWERANFYLNYSGRRARSASDSVATVPTDAERAGDFSNATVGQTPVTIYDPTTHSPFPGNIIPASRLNPAAVALLQYFPQPTFDGAIQNYSIAPSVPSSSNSVSLRTVMPLPTNKDSISFNVQYQGNHSNSETLFGFRDTSSGYGTSATVAWSHSFKPRFNNNASFAFSRNISRGTPYFAYKTNVEGELGITGTDQSAIDWGPPNLSFTNFGSLSDGSATSNRSQTSNFTDTITYVIRRKHNLSFGFGYRKLQQNALSYASSRGSFSFSGLLTSGFDASGNPVSNTGYDLADFLLGLPQSSSLRIGNSNNYFRGWATNVYAQDDFRVMPGVTLNLGIRYEYFSPYTELYGHIANLDINSAMTQVAIVTPGERGAFTGAYPSSLVNPDPNNFSPRFGFAFRPSQKRSLIFRGGYSIFYSGSAYGQIAAKLAAQPPFATTGTQSTNIDDPLTLQYGFPTQPSTITSTWAINKNYKLAYAQTWSFAVQQTLPSNTIVELEYIGAKGTGLGVQFAPNQALAGSSLAGNQQLVISNASSFLYQTDSGNSIFHAAQVRLTRRFSRGMSAVALYTFSKSIDDASSFNGLGGTVVQNPLDLSAERGLSSFDQRHRFSLNYTLSSPVGIHGFWRNGDWKTKAFSGWTLTGNFTANSGMPLTALVGGNLTNSRGNGAVGQLRADATGQSITAGNNLYFNLLAFNLPAAGEYGNAGVATIPGIFTTSLNGSLNRAWRFGEAGRQTLQLRLSANNAMNHVQITGFGTTINSSTYGLATAASATRTVTLTLRFNF